VQSGLVTIIIMGQGPGARGRGWGKEVYGSRKMGRERVESGIFKVARSGRNRKKITQHCRIFCNHKAGTGNKGNRKKEAWTPMSPPNCVPQIEPSEGVFLFLQL